MDLYTKASTRGLDGSYRCSLIWRKVKRFPTLSYGTHQRILFSNVKALWGDIFPHLEADTILLCTHTHNACGYGLMEGALSMPSAERYTCHVPYSVTSRWERSQTVSAIFLTRKLTFDMQICTFFSPHDNLLSRLHAALMWNHPDRSERCHGSVRSRDNSHSCLSHFCIPASSLSFIDILSVT